MEITPAWIQVGMTAATVLAGGGIMWAKVESTKKSCNILFTKCDDLSAALSAHQLSAAKEYVNIAALKDIMAPILTRLDNIDRHLFQDKA